MLFQVRAFLPESLISHMLFKLPLASKKRAISAISRLVLPFLICVVKTSCTVLKISQEINAPVHL